MMSFGQKIIVVSTVIIILWMCVGYIMYSRSLQFAEENNKLSKSPEQEVSDCQTRGQKLSPGFWQRIDLHKMRIPESLKESLSAINIETSSITVQGNKVHYIYAKPKDLKSGISVLLLHGQSFTSETWNEIGTIKTLAALGYYPIAVDLPGYGQSPAIADLNKSNYMDDLIAALNVRKPVLVSPSMSGSFSLRYLIEHPDKFGGYIPISPIHTNILSDSCPNQVDDGIDVFLNEDCQKIMHHLKSNEIKLNCIKVPTLVVWGERDRGENSAKLCLLPESQGAEIPNGRHPAYLSNPDLWHTLLYNFVSVLNETQVCWQNV